jgi:16S rRNA A1518/A1519 N6-dimethyltransferase RsmA/KsgA/DIM1 with predicted DNA glycosylase/AP lyase activity
VFEREPGAGEDLVDREHFGRLVKWSFSQRRKQLGNLLHRAPSALLPGGGSPQDVLERLFIEPAARPENLSVAQWVALSNALSQSAGR